MHRVLNTQCITYIRVGTIDKNNNDYKNHKTGSGQKFPPE